MSSDSYYIGRYEGYKKGYLKAKKEYQSQGILCTESDRKVIEDEVWKFLVFLINEMDVDDKYECFNQSSAYRIVSTMSYQEAKAKYEAWEKEKDKIHIGDEVQFTDVTNTIITLVVTRVDDNRFDGMDNKGRLYIDRTSNLWKKTGRHFDEVEELLRKIGGGKE